MFTGIVEEIGTLTAVRAEPPASLTVSCATVLEGTAVGDSISVAGCCLTVTTLDGDGDGGAPAGFTADLMGETLARTALGERAVGDPVNLERSLRADGRLGGHLVQGHVDGVATVADRTDVGEWETLRVALPDALAPYVVEKGSVAVDGVSLTVAGVEPGAFTVGLIPHTLAATTLGGLAPGDAVNLEADVIAKYVARLLSARTPSPYAPPEEPTP